MSSGDIGVGEGVRGGMDFRVLEVSEIDVPRERVRQEHSVEALAESISREGMHQPIVVTEGEDGRFALVIGFHRLKAVKMLGHTIIPAKVTNLTGMRAELAEISENLERNEVSTMERAVLIAKRDRLLVALGERRGPGRPKKRTLSVNPPTVGGFSASSVRETPPDYSADSADTTADRSAGDDEAPVPNNVRQIGTADLARGLGMSAAGMKNYRQIAQKIAQPLHARISRMPLGDNLKELGRLSRLDYKTQMFVVSLIHTGKVKTVREALRDIERAKTRKLAGEVGPVRFEDGPFRTIVLDPPWSSADTGDDDPMGKIAPDYATMSLEEIAALAIPDYAHPDGCHLYLWVTGRIMPRAQDLMEGWGFRYIQPLVWEKHRQGTGTYYANQTEFVLFGVRGTQLLTRAGVPNIVKGRRRQHSRKPDEMYDLIRECSPGPRLDMFSRESRDGFVGWGAEHETNRFLVASGGGE